MPGLVFGVFTGFDHHVGSLFTQAFLGSRGWGHDKASFSLNSSGVGGRIYHRFPANLTYRTTLEELPPYPEEDYPSCIPCVLPPIQKCYDLIVFN